nr:Dentin sialoprotein [Ipomoea batatas]
MASPLPKQLGQFLQEQQEPFTLQLYLHERGHVTCNSSNSEQNFPAASANPCKFLKGTNLLPRCLHLVKAVLGKLSLDPKIKKIQDSTESDNFSSATSADSDAEDAGPTRISSTLHGKQVVADRKMRAKCGEDSSKQLSPVSVLEETETESSEDDDETECFVGMSDGTNLLPPVVYSKNKIGRQQSGRALDSDKLWKLICESLVMWSQDSVDETNINHLVLSDFMASGKEWRGVGEVQGKEIGVRICGVILEDICCEIVRDLISFGA